MEPPTPCGFEINLVETKELGTTVMVQTVDSSKVSLMGQWSKIALKW